jgi:hypothetical protein
MLEEYVTSTIGPDDYDWLSEAVPTVAVKSVLISFDFSGRNTPRYQKRCEQLAKLAGIVRANFAELQRTGHAKWKEVNLDQDLGLWQPDSCSRPARREPPQAKEEGLFKGITEILKGRGPSR